MSAPELLSMGRTLIDLYPEQDGPLERVTSFAPAVGGSPANVAIAAARLGVRAGMVSRVGDDAFGRAARDALAADGVDVTQVVAIPDGVTPVAIPEISPPDSFPLTIYRPVQPVDVAIGASELDEQAFRRARIIWTSLSGSSAEPSRGAHRRAAELRSDGADLVLDLDYRPAFWESVAQAGEIGRAMARDATVLIGNLAECGIVTGATTPDSAADALLGFGARLAIVKLGGDGVLAATADARLIVPPIPVEVVNGLGSGDAFGGALCRGLLDGAALGELIGFANAAGALVATRRGCSTAMPSRSEVEELRATSRRG